MESILLSHEGRAVVSPGLKNYSFTSLQAVALAYTGPDIQPAANYRDELVFIVLSDGPRKATKKSRFLFRRRAVLVRPNR